MYLHKQFLLFERKAELPMSLLGWMAFGMMVLAFAFT